MDQIRVNTGSTASEVRAAMNKAVAVVEGQEYWSPAGLGVWKTLCNARNQFVRKKTSDKLREDGHTAYSSLSKFQKQNMTHYLVAQFKESFFSYSRGEKGMLEAVGNNDSWIRVEGMANYHVRQALLSITKDKIGIQENAGPSTADPVVDATSRPHYDPVKDSATGNPMA